MDVERVIYPEMVSSAWPDDPPQVARVLDWIGSVFPKRYLVGGPEKRTQEQIQKLLQLIANGHWLILKGQNAAYLSDLLWWIAAAGSCTFLERARVYTSSELIKLASERNWEAFEQVQTVGLLAIDGVEDTMPSLDWLHVHFFDLVNTLRLKNRRFVTWVRDSLDPLVDFLGAGAFDVIQSRMKLVKVQTPVFADSPEEEV